MWKLKFSGKSKTMRYWIALGSNLGDRLNNLKKAAQAFGQWGKVEKKSPVYRTTPWGRKDQPDFFNAVLALNCDLNPFRLLRKLKSLELQLGRVKGERWGARKIDLDILEWEGETIRSNILQIPHPYLERRLFVLQPLAYLDENFQLRSGFNVRQVIAKLNEEPNCQLVIEKW